MSQTVNCSACGKALRVRDDVSDPWLTCPRCLTQIANPAGAVVQGGGAPARQPGAVPPPDREARGGLSQTYWLVLAVTVLCVIGIGAWWHSGRHGSASEEFAIPALLLLFLMLDVLVLIPVGKVVFSSVGSGSNPLLNILRALLAVVAFLVVAWAVVVFFGAACAIVVFNAK